MGGQIAGPGTQRTKYRLNCATQTGTIADTADNDARDDVIAQKVRRIIRQEYRDELGKLFQ
jgi:hypothetical protein